MKTKDHYPLRKGFNDFLGYYERRHDRYNYDSRTPAKETLDPDLAPEELISALSDQLTLDYDV